MEGLSPHSLWTIGVRRVPFKPQIGLNYNITDLSKFLWIFNVNNAFLLWLWRNLSRIVILIEKNKHFHHVYDLNRPMTLKRCPNNSISPELSSPLQKTSYDLRKLSYRHLAKWWKWRATATNCLKLIFNFYLILSATCKHHK